MMKFASNIVKIGGLMLLLILVGCSKEEDVYHPKRTAYHRIDLPEHSYKIAERALPYLLTVSEEAEVRDHQSKVENIKGADYWVDIYYPKYDATIYMGYRMIRDSTQMDDYMRDAYALAGKHMEKAKAVKDYQIGVGSGYEAGVFELAGDVPTPFQFYVTDKKNHYVRGALYFKTSEKTDSLMPIAEHIKVDITHMMNQMKFVN